MNHKTSMLEKLYNGEICPADHVTVDAPDYLPTWNEITKRLEQLAEPAEAERLDTLIGKIAVMNAGAGFTHGLRFGMALAKELMEP